MRIIFLYHGILVINCDKRGSENMEEARRKIRICLVCVVTAAVVIGMIYYFRDVKGIPSVNEGTLVFISEGVNRLWQS